MGVSHFCCCVALEQKGICNLQEGEADVKVPFNYNFDGGGSSRF